jgi:predicted nuclease with TOPRIM domain
METVVEQKRQVLQLRDTLKQMQQDKVLLFSKAREATKQVQTQNKALHRLEEERKALELSAHGLKSELAKVRLENELMAVKTMIGADTQDEAVFVTSSGVSARNQPPNKKLEVFLEHLLGSETLSTSHKTD